ncbi:MAG: helix-turn-helix domain-containing protein [Treponema sp.]|jgi:transcriptional regulator with XRE-family HTH domain|nr:helix-turn-helix domain-containing protein [Treponema sp.]
MDFGSKIRTLRLGKKDTLHRLAMGTDIDMTLLSKIERGARMPTKDQITKLANYFCLDENELAVEAAAEKILFEYGLNDITFEAVSLVKERIAPYYAGKAVK